MAIKQAQGDRKATLDFIRELEHGLINYKISFEKFKELKDAIFANQPRKDVVIAYFTNCDCDYEWDDIVIKYQEFKTIYDYLI